MNTTNEHYLAELKTFFTDVQICQDCSRLVEHFSVRLAALGRAPEVLDVIEQSPAAELFVSLADGLRLYLGRPVEGPASEASEIALQIHQAMTEFAFDHEVEAELPFGHEAEIDYGFVRAAVSAA
jgi:hypothetical protein